MQYTLKHEYTFSQLKTVTFVDYESWYWGMINQYGAVPDIIGWFADLKEKGRIHEVVFFGDFSQDSMLAELPKLRNISNNIIDCRKDENKKDYTDFIMLDHIYQRLVRYPDIEQFVLFTGDNHFQSVVAFLRNFNDKTVGIYAVKGTLSKQLSETADWCLELSPNESSEDRELIQKLIIDNLTWAEDHGIFPSFRKTVNTVCRMNPGTSRMTVSDILSDMIKKDCITQTVITLPPDDTQIRIMKVDWDAIKDYSVYTE